PPSRRPRATVRSPAPRSPPATRVNGAGSRAERSGGVTGEAAVTLRGTGHGGPALKAGRLGERHCRPGEDHAGLGDGTWMSVGGDHAPLADLPGAHHAVLDKRVARGEVHGG